MLDNDSRCDNKLSGINCTFKCIFTGSVDDKRIQSLQFFTSVKTSMSPPPPSRIYVEVNGRELSKFQRIKN